MAPYPGQEEGLNRMMKLVNSFLARPDCSPFAEPVDWRGLELYDYPQVITHMMDLGTVKRKLERGQYRTVHECAQDIKLVWNNCMKYNADGSDFWLLAKTLSRRFDDRYRKIKQEFDVGETLKFDANDNLQPPQLQDSSSAKISDDSNNATATNTKKTGRKSASSSPVPPSSTTATSSTSSSSPSLDVRAKFAANLFFLSGSELGHVITELECHCPEALEQLPPPPTTPPPAFIQKNHWLEINVDVIPPKLFHSLQKYVTDKVGTMASSPSHHHYTTTVNNNSNKKQRQSTDSAAQNPSSSSVSSSKNLLKLMDDEEEDTNNNATASKNVAGGVAPTTTTTATSLTRPNSSGKKRKSK